MRKDNQGSEINMTVHILLDIHMFILQGVQHVGPKISSYDY